MLVIPHVGHHGLGIRIGLSLPLEGFDLDASVLHGLILGLRFRHESLVRFLHVRIGWVVLGLLIEVRHALSQILVHRSVPLVRDVVDSGRLGVVFRHLARDVVALNATRGVCYVGQEPGARDARASARNAEVRTRLGLRHDVSVANLGRGLVQEVRIETLLHHLGPERIHFRRSLGRLRGLETVHLGETPKVIVRRRNVSALRLRGLVPHQHVEPVPNVPRHRHGRVIGILVGNRVRQRVLGPLDALARARVAVRLVTEVVVQIGGCFRQGRIDYLVLLLPLLEELLVLDDLVVVQRVDALLVRVLLERDDDFLVRLLARDGRVQPFVRGGLRKKALTFALDGIGRLALEPFG